MQDRFFTELRESTDGFSVVAESFGRGVMSLTPSIAAQVVSANNKRQGSL